MAAWFGPANTIVWSGKNDAQRRSEVLFGKGKRRILIYVQNIVALADTIEILLGSPENAVLKGTQTN